MINISNIPTWLISMKSENELVGILSMLKTHGFQPKLFNAIVGKKLDINNNKPHISEYTKLTIQGKYDRLRDDEMSTYGALGCYM